MPVSRPITVFILGAALLAPGLALAQAPRLLLDPADADRDGVVSDAERADRLAAAPAEVIVVSAQWPERRLISVRPHEPLDPGPLDMARRVAPPSEFEVALEDRFNREVRKRNKD
jgi:hypothetical protein